MYSTYFYVSSSFTLVCGSSEDIETQKSPDKVKKAKKIRNNNTPNLIGFVQLKWN